MALIKKNSKLLGKTVNFYISIWFLYDLFTYGAVLVVAHLCVGVVTVGGKKYLGDLFNPGQEDRNSWLKGKHLFIQDLINYCLQAEIYFGGCCLLTSLMTYLSKFLIVCSFSVPYNTHRFNSH